MSNLERHDYDCIRNGMAEVVTLSRESACRLIDLLPDEYEWLVTALDEAQGTAHGEGKTGYIVVKVTEQAHE